MIRIHALFAREGVTSRMLLQVHDELVFEAPPSEIDYVSSLVKQEMQQAAKLSVPLVVDLGIGRNWLETKQ